MQLDSTIKRHKASCSGFQTQDIDYFEIFSPVVRYESVRAVLAVVARYEIAQFDVKTAFLNNLLKEDIYIQQPEGYKDGSNRICHLKKALYGFKQASRNWNDKFNEFAITYGLRQLESDPCIFIKGTKYE